MTEERINSINFPESNIPWNERPISELDVKITDDMIEGLKHMYSRLWATFNYAFLYMTDKDIARMVYIAVNVCSHCYEEDKNCKCWNDE